MIFDSVKHETVLNLLREQVIKEHAIKLYWSSYADGTTVIALHKDTNTISIERGGSHADRISLKLFKYVLSISLREIK